MVDSRSKIGKLNAIGQGSYGKQLKDTVYSNTRGALIGCIAVTLLAMKFNKPLVPSGVIGLLLGSVFLKLK